MCRESLLDAPGTFLGGHREDAVVSPRAVDVQEARGIADLSQAQLLHQSQRVAVLGSDADLDAVQADRPEAVVHHHRHGPWGDTPAGDVSRDPVADGSPLRGPADHVADGDLPDETTIDLDHVAPIRASVTDAVIELTDELARVGHINFRALTASLMTRLEVVVRFLAVLELFKQGRVDLQQPTTFGDIEIQWLGASGSIADDDPWTAGLSLVDAYDG